MAATPGPWITIDYFWIGRAGAINSEFITCDNGPDADYIKRVSPDVVLALLAELEAKDKRIAELEAKTAMTMGVGSGNGNLFVHGDYDSIKAAQAIVLENESLRAKLATPVRLPDTRFIKVGETAVAVMHATSVKEQIQHAGFKVEGDE